MAEAGVDPSRKGAVPLNTLTKDELVAKCKTLLQLAQRAKQAKDDLAKKLETKEAELAEQHNNQQTTQKPLSGQSEPSIQHNLVDRLEELEAQNALLDSQREDLDDLVKAKQRKLDRLSNENDALLQEIEATTADAKHERHTAEQQLVQINTYKAKISELEKKVSKVMEMEASVICAKETEKQLKDSIKQIEAKHKKQTDEIQRLNDALNIEKKLNADKNLQIKSLSQLSKREPSDENSDKVAKIKENNTQVAELEAKLCQLQDEKTKQNEITMEQIRSLKEKLASYISSDQVNNDKLHDHDLKITSLETENRLLTTTNQGMIVELNELNAEMKSRGEKISQLEQECQQLDSMKQREASTSEQLVTRSKELNDSRTSLTEALARNDALKESVEKLNIDLDEERQQSREYERMTETQAKEIMSLDVELSTCREQMSVYKENFKKLSLKCEANKSQREADMKLVAELNAKLENAEDEIAKLSQDIEERKVENDYLRAEALSAETNGIKADFMEKVDILNQQLHCTEESLKILENKREAPETHTETSNEQVIEQIRNYEKEMLELRSENEKLVLQCATAAESLLNISTKLDASSLELKRETDNHAQTIESMEFSKNKLLQAQQQLEQLRSTNAELSDDLSEKSTLISTLNVDKAEMKDQYTCVKNEILKLESELETTMRTVVSALKSKFSFTCCSTDTLAQNMERLLTEVSSKMKEGEVLSRRCADLTRELETIRNSSLTEHDDSRSEIMSTSTVSKAEDISRMKDVEDSFEERYSKLKLIAIKLKKRVGEQAKVIDDLEKSSRSKLADPDVVANLKEKVMTLTKNFTTLQAEYDQAIDNSDALEMKVKTLSKDLEVVMTESMNNKQLAEESLQGITSAKADAAKTADRVKELEIELASAKITLDQERLERKSLEEKTREADLTEGRLKDTCNQVKMLEDTQTTLKLQVDQLEVTVTQEQDRADRAQTQLATGRTHLNQVETELAKITGEAAELKFKFEEAQKNFEDTKQELSTVHARFEKTEVEERNRVSQLERQLSSVENKLQGRVCELQDRELELSRLRAEFDKYKVRAQSVLSQSREAANHPNSNSASQDELLAVEKLNDQLNGRIKSLAAEVKTIEMEKSVLQDEHDRLMERHSLLLQELATKEKNWRSKFDGMETSMKALKLSVDEISAKHSQEITLLKHNQTQELDLSRSCHLQEINRLKTQIDVAENEIVRLEFVLQKEQDARKFVESQPGSRPEFDRDRLDISQIEREAAEGQEVEPAHPIHASNSSPLPLEQLLAQSEHHGAAGWEERGVSRSAASSRQGGPDRQLTHLSTLLAESEAQNGRLEKLTEVLKEEIRTYQRSEERHKHIENMEYVKNVILKFVTLNGEERARLVPVLSTILKLSKNEIAKIEQIVKVEPDDGDGEGWASYLPLWT